MKIARVNGRRTAVMDSPFGPGGTTAQPALDDLSDVDLTGLADGDTIVYDLGTTTWVPGTGGGSASLPWSYAQADGALAGDGTTDDTTAFQTWIDTVTASGTQSGWFWFEPGTYLISGALQDTGAFNGQILLPSVSTSDPQITLTFQGPARPPMETHGTLPAPGGYAILKSTLTGGTGTAACISGGQVQNNIEVVVKDIICIAPNNPTFTFWNLAYTLGGKRDGLMIATAVWTGTRTQPTNTNAYGIKLPQINNSDLAAEDAVMVVGFYTGVLHGELAWSHFIIVNCVVGIELPAVGHPGGYINTVQTSCNYGIRATGTNYTDIWYDAEHNNTGMGGVAWADQVYDIDDSSNYIHGHIRWFGVLAGVGIDNSFTVNGAANTFYEEIGKLGPASGVTAGSYANPTVTVDVYGRVTAASAGSGSGTTDHEHIMNLWFSGDGSTTVFTLPAGAFDSQSVRVWVSGTLTDVTLSGAILDTMTFGSAPASATNNIVVDLVAAAA